MVFYAVWHLAFFVLCMFRPVIDMFVPASAVTLLISVAAFAKPETANGMPFWAFILMAVGFTGFALIYAKFIGWFAPPGLNDHFERYRRSDWR